jgi:hypothetical protein
MVDLPAAAVQRIDVAREAAEKKLERALAPFKKSEEVLGCAPAFAKFLRALFRAEAREREKIAVSAESLDADLEDLLKRTIENGMPDEGLEAGRAPGDDKATLLAERNVTTGTLRVREKGPEGVREASGDPAYRQHGDWELLMPLGVRFRVRKSFYPETNAAVREVCKAELREEKNYWMHRFRARQQRLALADQLAETTPPPGPSAIETPLNAGAAEPASPVPASKVNRSGAGEPRRKQAKRPLRKKIRTRDDTLPVNGAELKRKRDLAGLTQVQLALRVGLGVSTIARAEQHACHPEQKPWRWQRAWFKLVAEVLTKEFPGELTTARDLEAPENQSAHTISD